MNFSDSFEYCPYCEGQLVIQSLSDSPTCIYIPVSSEDIFTENDELLTMSDEELIEKYNSYFNLIKNQISNITKEQFVYGLRLSKYKKNNNDDYHTASTPQQSTTSTPQYIPKCPTCGSPNIRKIDGIERGASIVMFGIFSKKINKTFKCKNCGHTW